MAVSGGSEGNRTALQPGQVNQFQLRQTFDPLRCACDKRLLEKPTQKTDSASCCGLSGVTKID